MISCCCLSHILWYWHYLVQSCVVAIVQSCVVAPHIIYDTAVILYNLVLLLLYNLVLLLLYNLVLFPLSCTILCCCYCTILYCCYCTILCCCPSHNLWYCCYLVQSFVVAIVSCVVAPHIIYDTAVILYNLVLCCCLFPYTVRLSGHFLIQMV